jgi:hypothetical protein
VGTARRGDAAAAHVDDEQTPVRGPTTLKNQEKVSCCSLSVCAVEFSRLSCRFGCGAVVGLLVFSPAKQLHCVRRSYHAWLCLLSTVQHFPAVPQREGHTHAAHQVLSLAALLPRHRE